MRLIPRDEGFFPLFNDIASRMTDAARLLCELFDQPQRVEELKDAIKKVEHEADRLTHEINARIDRTFITPFDREDIHLLANALDNVIDLIDGVSHRASMFHITNTRAPARGLAAILLRAAQSLAEAVQALRRGGEASQRRAAIKQLEEEGDTLYREAVAELFRGNPDPIEVIKWKEIYDRLERAIDECQRVANVLEGISLKNS